MPSDYQTNAFDGGSITQDLFDISPTQMHRLGETRELLDGRKFVYCQDDGTGLAAGICISKATAPQECTIAAADVAYNIVGARTITATLTGTPTANLYRDGMMVITAGGGIGESYKIESNTADDLPASGRCTFVLYDALQTLHVAANTTVSVYENPYQAVLINPAVANGSATTEEKMLGVTQRIITASYYFWAQTWGLGSVICDSGTTIGAESDEARLYAGTTNGRMIAGAAAAADAARPVYGNVIENADVTDAEAMLVFLRIS